MGASVAVQQRRAAVLPDWFARTTEPGCLTSALNLADADRFKGIGVRPELKRCPLCGREAGRMARSRSTRKEGWRA